MAKKFENVTILLPAMDETYSLRETVERILNTCKKKDLAEFIIILCGKTTPECRGVAEALVEEYSKTVPIYIHDQTLPFVGGAVREGIDLAKGSHVVMMSTDLETDPDVIRIFIKGAKKYPDRIITASRWKKGGGFKNYSKIKLVCNLIFERAIGIFYLTYLSDLTYAYRIFPTDLMQSIAWEELKHPFFLETALKPLRLGVKFAEVPARWKARTEGTSQNTFLANFNYFKTAWHNRFLSREQILRSDKENA
ncbi:MAG: glycosyltransferase family 2 protein [Lachnospiraceae bacterium]|nr:glycosyltransferase family 2 protein [Lachnospiraceae bacterium]